MFLAALDVCQVGCAGRFGNLLLASFDVKNLDLKLSIEKISRGILRPGHVCL